MNFDDESDPESEWGTESDAELSAGIRSDGAQEPRQR